MDWQRLRLLNQDLLQTLRTNQEEFRKQIRAQLPSPSSTCRGRAAPERGEIAGDDKDRLGQKDFQGQFPRSATNAWKTASPGLGKPTPGSSWSPRERLHPGPQGAKVPPPEVPGTPQAEGGRPRKGQRKAPVPSGEPNPRGKKAEMPGGQRAATRMPQTPKSILLTPGGRGSREQKEAGRVTFNSDPEEYTIPADRWSVRPLLGYDWIAGLLDMDSSVAEKPDQYFSELQEFRRVNREACVYDRDSWSEGPDSSAHNHELVAAPVSHQCVFCYRLNKRLFPEALDPESACPVCRTPRARRPPETPIEPAFVRISIPRSTLLPAYKHKIHRRKSYTPADDLALPSHCLAGWENAIEGFTPTPSNLDLHSSLDAPPAGRSKQNSRVLGGTRTDKLLDLSRVAEFELGSVARQWNHLEPPLYRAAPN